MAKYNENIISGYIISTGNLSIILLLLLFFFSNECKIYSNGKTFLHEVLPVF